MVSIPGLPLIPLIYSSQLVNAVLLPLHVIALLLLARNANIIGEAKIGQGAQIAAVISIVLILACVGAMAFS